MNADQIIENCRNKALNYSDKEHYNKDFLIGMLQGEIIKLCQELDLALDCVKDLEKIVDGVEE